MSTELKQSLRSIGHTTHGHTSRELLGSKDTATYRSWTAMRTRCRTKGRDNADRYADKGITICERWLDFANFLSDMGVRPEGKTLDRWPDHAGNYEPSNCRWATPQEQARNTRRSKLTLETATEVAVMRLRGVQCKVICSVFGISESLPREIVKGRCWPDALAAANKIIGEENA